MKLSRCPVCHSNLHLDALVQDHAGKALLGAIARLPDSLAISAVPYLALFRPQKSDLSNSRALKLLNQVLKLTPNQAALAQALDHTVSQLSAKRQQGEHKPLTNHNYLKKVLHGIPSWDQPQEVTHVQRSRPQSTSDISQHLTNVHDDSWAQ